jgi:hypothetical protein
MAQWEYTYEWITAPLDPDGVDVTPGTIDDLNTLGLEGWEVCSVLEYQQYWLVLLKREVSSLPGG